MAAAFRRAKALSGQVEAGGGVDGGRAVLAALPFPASALVGECWGEGGGVAGGLAALPAAPSAPGAAGVN